MTDSCWTWLLGSGESRKQAGAWFLFSVLFRGNLNFGYLSFVVLEAGLCFLPTGMLKLLSYLVEEESPLCKHNNMLL